MYLLSKVAVFPPSPPLYFLTVSGYLFNIYVLITKVDTMWYQAIVASVEGAGKLVRDILVSKKDLQDYVRSCLSLSPGRPFVSTLLGE